MEIDIETLKNLRKDIAEVSYLCDPECEGRCRVCPQELMGRINDFLGNLVKQEK